MGLNPWETAVFLAGVGLIARFLLDSAVPTAFRRFRSAASRHSDDLREEFVYLPPVRIAAAWILSGTLCACFALALSKSKAAAVVSGVAPLFFAGEAIRRYRIRRKNRILAGIPSFLDLLAGHVKAGHSLTESLSETVPLLPAGIREEMTWVLHRTRLGTPLADSFAHWEERLRSEDVSLLVRPLRATLAGGGNIVDLLEQTRDVLRLRTRAKEKLRSMTAQARLQALVLTLLPPAFAAVLAKIDPSFLPNLVGTLQGKILLLAAATLQALGWLTIRRILSVRP